RTVLALIAALVGLCCLNFIGAHRFAPSVESNMFLAARLLDGRVAQPVLDEMGRLESIKLCSIRAIVDDPRRVQPGQDYLWAGDTRAHLAAQDAEGLRSEE